MKLALVELHVEIRGRAPRSLGSAIKDAIRRDRTRRTKVLQAMREAKHAGCNVVLFPGWTVSASAPPEWLVDASKGMTVIFECLAADGDAGSKHDADHDGFRSTTYVVSDTRTVSGPLRQVGATAKQIREPKRLARLAEDVRTGRVVPLRRSPAIVLICGEANIVSGLGDGCRLDSRVGLVERDLQRELVLNPAHTPGGPQAIRDKRAWLSRNGVLVTTANTHSGGGRRSAWVGAKAWVCGRRADERLAVLARKYGMTIRTLDLPDAIRSSRTQRP